MQIVWKIESRGTTESLGQNTRAAAINLLDHPTRDAVTRIAGWIRLVIIRLGMDHERRSAIREDRAVLAIRERRVDRRLRSPIGFHREVHQVTHVMAVRALQPVLLACGIQVRPRGGKSRPLALGILMDVDSVLARRQVLEVQFDFGARS